MNNYKNFEHKIDATEAFERLSALISFAKANGKEISDKQVAYCEEWLFDCVHCTGYTYSSTPVEIFNASFEAFEEENN